MSFITITKRFSFAAAHYLHNSKLSPEENKDLFGRCTGIRDGHDDMISHGHNYHLDVVMQQFNGSINPGTGMVLNFVDLKSIVKKSVLDKFDHRDICKEVEPFCFGEIPATAENMLRIMAARIGDELEYRKLFTIKLVHLRLYETDTSWADWSFG